MEYTHNPRGGSIAATPARNHAPEETLPAAAQLRTLDPHERPRAYCEIPLYPKKLPSFLPLRKMLKLPREEQERRLEKRAVDLLLEIEGLRIGYYTAPPDRERHRMLELARRRFRRLRNVAMHLGFWTDGRWDDGEEETDSV